jgi:hypothetical protein
VFALWHGHEAFHGGAFVTPHGAWALLGDRGAGKSSLLAGLAIAGQKILTDDLIVVVDDVALAGPRCADLRESALVPLELDGRTEPVRGGERHRLRLSPVEAEVPLRGWILLSWGAGLNVRALEPGERLRRLTAQRNGPGAHPTRLLELARLPAWELERPLGWESLEPAVRRLLDVAHT